MKRHVLSISLLIAFAIILFVLRKKLSTTDMIIIQSNNTGSSVAQLLANQTTETGSTTGVDVIIQPDQLQGMSYAGGGEYKPFFAQTAKQLMQQGKDIILYFYKAGDPTDEALDNNIQKRSDRIPANTVILRVDYDSNQSLKDTFGVTQRNTLIYLDSQGSERTRRAVGITTLAQIVQAIENK